MKTSHFMFNSQFWYTPTSIRRSCFSSFLIFTCCNTFWFFNFSNICCLICLLTSVADNFRTITSSDTLLRPRFEPEKSVRTPRNLVKEAQQHMSVYWGMLEKSLESLDSHRVLKHSPMVYVNEQIHTKTCQLILPSVAALDELLDEPARASEPPASGFSCRPWDLSLLGLGDLDGGGSLKSGIWSSPSSLSSFS